jgi:hypothetical protein
MMITKIKETLKAARAFKKIAQLVKKEPNDFTLGTKVRDLFWKEKWNK